MLNLTLSGGSSRQYSVLIDEKLLDLSAKIGSVSYYQIPAGVTSFSKLQVVASYTVSPGTHPTLQLLVNDVSKSTAIGGTGTTKQLARSLSVGGSVPTSGSIAISSPSSIALGNTLVYTTPDTGSGFIPALRTYRVSGGTLTPDATCVSGFRESFISTGASAGQPTYTIPAGLLTEGSYVVMARILFTGDTTATLRAHASIGSYERQTTIGTVNVPFAGPVFVVIGVVHLPIQGVPPESQLPMVLEVTGTSDDGGTHDLDDVYLFDLTHGSLTWVADGVPSFSQLWIDSPDVDPLKNRPAIYIGNQSDRSDAASPPAPGLLTPDIHSFGDHDLDPGGISLFTITDKVSNATVTASFYKRWGTYAAE
jgi:hypothetical protein